MKRILLLGLLIIAIKSSAQTVLFSQDFSANSNINYYINANNPVNGFNGTASGSVSTGETAAVISIEGGKLVIDKTASTAKSSAATSFTRSTDFAPVPLVVKMECDIQVQNTTARSNGGSFSFEFGERYSHTTAGLVTTSASNVARSHSQFTLNLSTDVANQFQIRNIMGNANSTSIFTGEHRITWIINNSGNSYDYIGPDSSPQTVSNDTWDIWVGNTLVFEGAVSRNVAAQLVDFRMSIETGKTKVAVGNIKITSLLDTPLPVTLSSFTGKPQNKSVLLNWTTVSEQNNKQFTLSRSYDGKTFKEVAVLDGAGNSAAVKNYGYVDQNPYPGLNYYQLQQEDFNGDKQKPNVITVDSGISGTQLNAFVNAEGLVVNIAAPNKTAGKIELYNIYGQLVYTAQQQISWGNNRFVLPAIKNQGLYVIRYTADGRAISQKIKL